MRLGVASAAPFLFNEFYFFHVKCQDFSHFTFFRASIVLLLHQQSGHGDVGEITKIPVLGYEINPCNNRDCCEDFRFIAISITY